MARELVRKTLRRIIDFNSAFGRQRRITPSGIWSKETSDGTRLSAGLAEDVSMLSCDRKSYVVGARKYVRRRGVTTKIGDNPHRTMRIRLSVAALALLAIAPSGCIYVSAPPQRTVVQETRYLAPARETVITSLPPNYRVSVYRGQTYYVYNNVYYRAHPRGYVVVNRPW